MIDKPKAVTREDVEKAIDDFGLTCGLWYDTREPKEFERVKSKQAELEWMVSTILAERDGAVKQIANRAVKDAEQAEDVERIAKEITDEIHRDAEAGLSEEAILKRDLLIANADRDSWRLRAEEAEAKYAELVDGLCSKSWLGRDRHESVVGLAERLKKSQRIIHIQAAECIRAKGHDGPCNGLPRKDCITRLQRSESGGEVKA